MNRKKISNMTRKEALDVLRKNIPTDKSLPVYEALQTLIPELREDEDERIRRKMIEHFKAKTKETWCNMPVKDIIAYLEKQKEPENTSASTMAPSCWAEEHPKEQKPAEWSEEDADILNCCISSIEEAKENRYAYKETDGNTSYDREIAWLKSLRPQPSWKPSEEQMAALEAATVRYQSTGLESLYEDLKKL